MRFAPFADWEMDASLFLGFCWVYCTIMRRRMQESRREIEKKSKIPLDKTRNPCYNTEAVWHSELHMGV